MTAELIIFPDTMSGFPPCRGCWQPAPTAQTVDPRDDEIKPLCGDCAAALAAGRRLPELDGETWERIACLRQNEEIDDTDVDKALRDHAAHLASEVGRYVVEDLRDALLRLQEAEDPCTVLDVELIGPVHTPETYVNDCRALVESTRARLIGAR